MWPQQITTFDRIYWNNTLTPLQFARPFANVAKRQGKDNLAKETLSLGRDATRSTILLGYPYEKERFGIAPTSLVLAAICDFNAQMALLQVQFIGGAWLLASFLFWWRMAWVRRVIKHGWQMLALLWRVREQPLHEDVPLEMVHTPRDLRMCIWFCGAVILCGAAGMNWWSEKFTQWYYAFSEQQLNNNYDKQLLAYFLFAAGPLVGSFLWCGGTALWRYSKLPHPANTEANNEATHIPPSVIPFVVAFMVWSVTAVPFICWLLWAITYRYGAPALNFSLPPLWSGWLGQPNSSVDFSIRDIAIPIFLTFAALGAWLLKWIWQLHPRRRVAAMKFGLRWLHATLGVWFILGNWLYLAFLLIALPYHRAADAQITKALPATEISWRSNRSSEL